MKIYAFDRENWKFGEVCEVKLFNPHVSWIDGEVRMVNKINNSTSYQLLSNVQLIRSTGVKDRFGREELLEGDILTNDFVKIVIEYREELAAFVGWYMHMPNDSYEFVSNIPNNFTYWGNIYE